MRNPFIFILLFLPFCQTYLVAADHPGISLTPKSVKEIQSSLGLYPAFDHSYQTALQTANKALSSPIDVPVPKDGAGYTHETHKGNYYAMYYAGIIYQITGQKRYAEFVTDMLKRYALLYPTIGIHPVVKSATPGKLFWQTLNECVWLLHTAMAYDCVYDFISPADRQTIEKNLFYPMALFISEGNKENHKTFNKMHNHGTWATASVGMIGYVMEDQDLVNKALYGSNQDGKTGFLEQMNRLFSPDGYFTEGPYYQRYAIWPFMMFAQAIELRQPELEIFKKRDSILVKAVNTLLQCAYNGTIFHLNDALDKRYTTQEIVSALDIAYWADPSNRSLLSIAKEQNNYLLSEAGITTAKAVSEGKAQPFVYHSMLLTDGADGNQGGISIFRQGRRSDQGCLVFKATSHGLSHGHYDKLTFSYYDNGSPILTDYGAARFLNIEPKEGGRYTQENHTWAMQTIAHNTVAINQKSHFAANIQHSSLHASSINYCQSDDPNLQIVSATDNNAYQEQQIGMQRTMTMISDPAFEHPIIVDLFKIRSPKRATYDLPFYYNGQVISTDFVCFKNRDRLFPLGKEQGYQHLWVEAQSKSKKSTAAFTWLQADRFYSVTTLTDPQSELFMLRAGANDPKMNIRNQPAFMIRQKGKADHTFASVIEAHGLYDLNIELTKGYDPQIKTFSLPYDKEDYSMIVIQTQSGKKVTLIVANKDFGHKKSRTLKVGEQLYQWKGNYYYNIE